MAVTERANRCVLIAALRLLQIQCLRQIALTLAWECKIPSLLLKVSSEFAIDAMDRKNAQDLLCFHMGALIAATAG